MKLGASTMGRSLLRLAEIWKGASSILAGLVEIYSTFYPILYFLITFCYFKYLKYITQKYEYKILL